MVVTGKPVILASASTARAALLRAAGVDVTVEPAAIDGALLKHIARQAGDSATACAITLASAKASLISHRYPEAFVIGADQILAAGAEWFDKPGDLAEAATQLRMLRGRSHTLATAVCVAQDGKRLWHVACAPEMCMRWFSDAFIEEYIAAEGEALLGSVGAYRIEGKGVQLVSRIAGDHFAVLGLPLVELLDFLRERGVILA